MFRVQTRDRLFDLPHRLPAAPTASAGVDAGTNWIGPADAATEQAGFPLSVRLAGMRVATLVIIPAKAGIISRLDILRRVGGRHAALYEPLQAMEQQTHTSPNSLDFGHRSYRVGLSRPLECGGKRSATPLLIVGGAETRPQSVSCGMPKAPSSLRSAGALLCECQGATEFLPYGGLLRLFHLPKPEFRVRRWACGKLGAFCAQSFP